MTPGRFMAIKFTGIPTYHYRFNVGRSDKLFNFYVQTLPLPTTIPSSLNFNLSPSIPVNGSKYTPQNHENVKYNHY